MPRGGYREGAGRKSKGNLLNPRAIKDISNRIKADSIIKRLQKHIEGDAEMAASAVTAALGLLRKVIPDLAAVNHTGQVEIKRAAELTDDELAAIAAKGGGRDTQAPDDTPQFH